MTVPQPAPDGPIDRKPVLFCSVCGYDAPVDGEWSVQERACDRTDINCPECDNLVVSQPSFDEPNCPRGRQRMFDPLVELVDTVVRHNVL